MKLIEIILLNLISGIIKKLGRGLYERHYSL